MCDKYFSLTARQVVAQVGKECGINRYWMQGDIFLSRCIKEGRKIKMNEDREKKKKETLRKTRYCVGISFDRSTKNELDRSNCPYIFVVTILYIYHKAKRSCDPSWNVIGTSIDVNWTRLEEEETKRFLWIWDYNYCVK